MICRTLPICFFSNCILCWHEEGWYHQFQVRRKVDNFLQLWIEGKRARERKRARARQRARGRQRLMNLGWFQRITRMQLINTIKRLRERRDCCIVFANASIRQDISSVHWYSKSPLVSFNYPERVNENIQEDRHPNLNLSCSAHPNDAWLYGNPKQNPLLSQPIRADSLDV